MNDVETLLNMIIEAKGSPQFDTAVETLLQEFYNDVYEEAFGDGYDQGYGDREGATPPDANVVGD